MEMSNLNPNRQKRKSKKKSSYGLAITESDQAGDRMGCSHCPWVYRIVPCVMDSEKLFSTFKRLACYPTNLVSKIFVSRKF